LKKYKAADPKPSTSSEPGPSDVNGNGNVKARQASVQDEEDDISGEGRYTMETTPDVQPTAMMMVVKEMKKDVSLVVD